MKRIPLLLLIFCSLFAKAQVIPQWQSLNDGIKFFYPGKSPSGYDSLYSYRFLKTIFLKKADTASLSNRIDQKISLSEKGIANGVSTLDGGGKVPLTQLPANLFVYQGLWNPNTNTPTLVDGIGTTGYTYEVSEDGIHDWGTRIDTLFQGDMVIYDGSKWQASRGTNRVVQVNGYQGIVDLNTDDIGEGTINKYFTDARVATYGDSHYYPLGSNPAGYLTSFTETDPTVPAYAKSLTAFSVIQTSTDALYQPIGSYLTSETDPIYTASSWYTTTNNSGNWDTAYSQTRQWDGSATGLTPATGRTSLGLGTLATQNGTFSGASSGTNTGDETTARINALYGYTPANGANYLPLTGGTLTGSLNVVGTGTFSDGTQGLIIGAYTSGLGYGAIYPYGVIPGATNFSFAANTNDTQLRSLSTIQMVIGTAGIGYFSSTGLSITGTGTFSSDVTATSFITSGGTSSQFLKADGSVDNNTYLTANQLISFTPTGDVTGSTSGTTALVPVLTIGAGKVTNTMLAGGIDLATKVTGVLPSANSSVSLLASFYTLTGNSGTTPTDIYSYTIPANTLSADGDFIDGTYTVAVGVQGSTIDNIEINFAGQTVANFGPFSHANASDGIITIVLKRISSSDAQCSATWMDNGGSVATGSVDFDLRQISSVNFTTTNVLKVIATGGSTNSIAFYDGYYRLNK